MVSKALFLPHITKKVVPSWIPLYIFGMTIILFQQWKSAIVNWRREEICRYSCSKIHQTTRLRKNCDHITYTQYSHTPRFVALGHLYDSAAAMLKYNQECFAENVWTASLWNVFLFLEDTRNALKLLWNNGIKLGKSKDCKNSCGRGIIILK